MKICRKESQLPEPLLGLLNATKTQWTVYKNIFFHFTGENGGRQKENMSLSIMPHLRTTYLHGKRAFIS